VSHARKLKSVHEAVRQTADTPAVVVTTILGPDQAGAREKTKGFLKQMFASGHYLEESFNNICADGCSAEEFAGLLHSICVFSSIIDNPYWTRFFRDNPDVPPIPDLLVNGGNLSKKQLRELPKRLRTMADTIAALNATPLSPANEFRLAPRSAERQAAIRSYESLPGRLRAYSWHVERWRKIARGMGKRLTRGHLNAVMIVRYVQDRTGSPHYTDISNLLAQGWMIAGETERVPGFLSLEGLTKLYGRWADVLFGPPRSHPRLRKVLSDRE
jgi:hypothetical protein